MRAWSVYVKAQVDLNVTEDALAELGHELELFDAAVSGGKGGYSVRLTVSSAELLEAIRDGVEVFTKAAALLGLPAGEIVVVDGKAADGALGRRGSRR